MINPTCKLRYTTNELRTICFHPVDLENVVFLLPQKRIKYTRKKKQAQKLIALIIYSVARGIPQPDVQIVNFEFIMWALGGDAIRVA